MNEKQMAMVRESWEELEPRAAEAGVMLYHRLFERDPATRRLFRGDDMEAQGGRLMEMIGMAIDALENPEAVMGSLQMLGAAHADEFGVSEKDYDTMEEALVDTLLAEFGEGFTDELETAWRRAYGTIANMMKQGARSEAA